MPQLARQLATETRSRCQRSRASAPITAHRPTLIDKTIYAAPRVEARQIYSNDLNSNAVVDNLHSRSPFGHLGPSVMFKIWGLNSSVSRLQIHSIRTLWATRVVRSFTTTLKVFGQQRPTSSRRHGHQHKKRRLSPPTIETNKLESNELQEPTLPSTQASQREVHPEIEVRGHLQDRYPESC